MEVARKQKPSLVSPSRQPHQLSPPAETLEGRSTFGTEEPDRRKES